MPTYDDPGVTYDATGITYNGQTAVEPHELAIEWESQTYWNRVYVLGSTPAGSGWFQDDAAIADANGLVRSTRLDASDSTTQAMAAAAAAAYLAQVARAKARGHFTATSPVGGWRAAQNVIITDAKLGLDQATFQIKRVRNKALVGGPTPPIRYTVEFGEVRAGS